MNIPDSNLIRAKNKLDDVSLLCISLKKCFKEMNREENKNGQNLYHRIKALTNDLETSRGSCQDNTAARKMLKTMGNLMKNQMSNQTNSQNILCTIESNFSEFKESDLQFTVRPETQAEYTITMTPKTRVMGSSLSRILSFGRNKKSGKNREISKLNKVDEEEMGDDQVHQLLLILSTRQSKRESLMANTMQNYLEAKKESLDKQIQFIISAQKELETIKKCIANDSRLEKNSTSKKEKISIRKIKIGELSDLILECYKALIKLEGHKTLGTFRISASDAQFSKFCENFHHLDRFDFTISPTPHIPANMIKLLLRNSEAPLFPTEVMGDITRFCLEAGNLNDDQKIQKFKEIEEKTPKANQKVLKVVSRILLHFSKFQKTTRMDLRNLVLMFNPCLFSRLREGVCVQEATKKIKLLSKFTLFMIPHYAEDLSNELNEL